MLIVLNPTTGRLSVLSTEEEKYLVDLIVTLQEWEQLSTCRDFLKYAANFIEVMDLKHRFVHGSPTKDWYYGFLRRWTSGLKVMVRSTLENARAKGATVEIIRRLFVIK